MPATISSPGPAITGTSPHGSMDGGSVARLPSGGHPPLSSRSAPSGPAAHPQHRLSGRYGSATTSSMSLHRSWPTPGTLVADTASEYLPPGWPGSSARHWCPARSQRKLSVRPTPTIRTHICVASPAGPPSTSATTVISSPAATTLSTARMPGACPSRAPWRRRSVARSGRSWTWPGWRLAPGCSRSGPAGASSRSRPHGEAPRSSASRTHRSSAALRADVSSKRAPTVWSASSCWITARSAVSSTPLSAWR